MCVQKSDTHTHRKGRPHVHTLICVSLSLGIICLTPLPCVSCSFSLLPRIIFLSTWHTSRSSWMPNWADWLIACASECVCVAAIIVYVICPAAVPYSPPSPLSLSLSPSQRRWHIEGTELRLGNLMEPLNHSEAWIKRGGSQAGGGRSLLSPRHSEADSDG